MQTYDCIAECLGLWVVSGRPRQREKAAARLTAGFAVRGLGTYLGTCLGTWPSDARTAAMAGLDIGAWTRVFGLAFPSGGKIMACGGEFLMRMFGRPEGFLGRLGGIIMARVNRHAAAQVIKLLDVAPDDTMLEIGFGPGVGIQLLLERVTSGSVAGVDQSQEMVRQAAARNAGALRNRRADLRYGSVERLPFADETFDKALAINSMQVWRDADTGLREIRRVLKPRGNVALCFTVNSGQSKDGILESLATAGFAHERMVNQPNLFCAIATKP